MRIITAESAMYEINEDRLEPVGQIQLQVSIGIPGTNKFSKPFAANYDPGAAGHASIILPMALLKELGLADKLPLLNVSEAEMADGSIEQELETLISLRLTTIPFGQSVIFDGIRCVVSRGAKADGTLIGMSVWRYFDVVMQNSTIRMLNLSAKLPER